MYIIAQNMSKACQHNHPIHRSGLPESTPSPKAPDDSPKIVTRFGSPPKAAMFCCTHCKAAMLSMSP